jgi:hypothetical protein
MAERITPGGWFAIGLYAGSSPLDLKPAPEVENPVLTYRDITDIPAIFVADPFLIWHDGLWYLFFEVLNEITYKGEIAVAVSEDARLWKYRGVVLVEDWNVSYPYVFRWQGSFYMMPEMYEQDCVRLYRAESFPFEWQPVADLIEDGPVADPSPFRFGESWWMFLCSRPLHNDVLRLYRSDNLMGPWVEHPASPIITGDRRSARPAGRVLPRKNSVLRFAQDCHPSYGSAGRAFEITHLTTNEYAERPVEAPPIQEPEDGDWNCVRLHHLDAHQLRDGSWLAVIDGHGHRQPWSSTATVTQGLRRSRCDAKS